MTTESNRYANKARLAASLQAQAAAAIDVAGSIREILRSPSGKIMDPETISKLLDALSAADRESDRLQRAIDEDYRNTVDD